MATGKSGSLTVTMGSYNMGTGYVTIYWQEECDYGAGTSKIVVYKATVSHSTWAGTFTVNATVYVNGQSIGGISGSTWYNDTMGAPAEISGVNLTSPAIAHNFDGSKSITISMTVHGASVQSWYVTDVSNSTTVALSTHTHSYTSSVTKEPTCATTGVRTYTCSCGSSYTEAIAATGNHSYSSTITKQPTCVVDGVKTYTCTTCNDSYTETIAATGNHSYVDTVVPPTCVEQGYTTHICSTCNAQYVDTYTSALGHNWEGVNCSVCGTSSIVPFKRIVHIYDGENWVKHYVRVTNKRRQSYIYKNLNDNPENAILGFAKLSTMKLGEGG